MPSAIRTDSQFATAERSTRSGAPMAWRWVNATRYEAIRDSYLKRGKSLKRSKQLGAMTWNKEHPDDPNPWLREKKLKLRRQKAASR